MKNVIHTDDHETITTEFGQECITCEILTEQEVEDYGSDDDYYPTSIIL